MGEKSGRQYTQRDRDTIHTEKSLARQKAIIRSDRQLDSDWDFYSSSLYTSPLRAYEERFASVLRGQSVRELAGSIQGAVVVDLMAPSDTLAEMFSTLPKDPNRIGIAVSLEDLRTPHQKERDQKLGITQLSLDLTTLKGWNDLESALGDRKADLVIERAEGGLDELPVHPVFYGTTIQRIWKLLGENGVMLLETPTLQTLDKSGFVPTRFKTELRKHSIDARFHHDTRALYVRKTASSPDTLPLSVEMMKPNFRLSRRIRTHSWGRPPETTSEEIDKVS